MSINEELQSANEELETSKEEMQSLNEELTTVNAQLRAKVEEQQATSSDLASLLASTDIAVLFLDTAFRIRRYTPAIRDLVDLITSDVGRPLTALARRFDDPHLDDDAVAVLERLVPVEREVGGPAGRHFLRRVLPYRTMDNRIDGVVITFVDITARKRAEQALRASEEQFRGLVTATSNAIYRMSPDWSEMRRLDGGGFLADTAAPSRTWLDDYVRPEDQPEVIAALRLADEANAVFAGEHRVRRADGTAGWTLSRAVPLLDEQGEIYEWFGAASDVTDRRLFEEALRRDGAWSSRPARGPGGRPERRAPGGVARHARAQRDRRAGAGHPGRPSWSGCPPPMPRRRTASRSARNPWRAGLATHTRQAILTGDVTKDARWEEWRWLAERFDYRGCWSFPIHNSAGKYVGTFAIYSRRPREATERDLELASLLTHTASIIIAQHAESEARGQAESAQTASEERLRLALAAARMGIWTWETATDAHARDANLNRLLGLEPVETRQPFEEFLRAVHPDDREAVSTAFHDSVKRGRPLNLEFRIVRPDGAVRWLRDQGDVFHEAAPGAPHLAGACVDITDLKEAEAAVREREERLRLIVESATDYAIVTLDAARLVTSWSPGAAAAFGYAGEEMLGRPADIIFTPEDRAAGAPEAEARTGLREGRAADERWHLRKDGTRFFASGVLTPLGNGGSRGFVKVARDLTDRKRMEDELREARDELEARVAERTAELARANEALRDALAARKELLWRVVSAQEDERRRISRELHDGLGQELTALILGLKALERATPEGAPGRARLLEVEAVVGRIGREAHDLAVELRPTALDDIGLGAALAAYVSRWSERTGVAAAFESLGLDGDRLPPEVESTVYRVVQEALNNAAKHAAARHVSVIVERRPDEVTTLVEDDGRGFDPARTDPGPDRRRLGLLGMRERLALVGGDLLVESGEDQGTTVRARIPIPESTGEAGDGG